MADQVLTIVFNTTTGVVTQTGLTSNLLPEVMKRILSTHGVVFDSADKGRILDTTTFSAFKRAQIKTDFDRHFDHDPNPYHATDNVTLVWSEA